MTGVFGGSSPVISRWSSLLMMWTKTRARRAISQVSMP